jgi:hypothetical protein
MTAMNDPMNKMMAASVAAADQASFNSAWQKELQDEYEFKLAAGHTVSQSAEFD